jgi:hypothetical protein
MADVETGENQSNVMNNLQSIPQPQGKTASAQPPTLDKGMKGAVSGTRTDVKIDEEAT